jgi:DNA uptake protein ComE-like DNA-binding protein
LPGIGPVTAGKIISGRPYQANKKLKAKKIVGNAVFEKIKNLITSF